MLSPISILVLSVESIGDTDTIA